MQRQQQLQQSQDHLQVVLQQLGLLLSAQQLLQLGQLLCKARARLPSRAQGLCRYDLEQQQLLLQLGR
jgi:hypothetical protein